MKESNLHESTVLLVMDVQNVIVGMMEKENIKSLMNSLVPAIETARKHTIPVIYVGLKFRKGYPEVSGDNKSFLRFKEKAIDFTTGEAGTIYSSVAPQPDDIVVTKKRVSAFTGSDLEVVLRSLKVNHLVLTGIATSGVVLSTLREAADKDHRLTVLSNCCADRDEEVHQVLMNKVFPRQADVINAEEWRKSL